MNYAIIAAGEGSRLAQEGVQYPKPLVRLNGIPMIRRLIDMFMRCNPTGLSIIVNEQMTEVQDYLRSIAPELPVKLHLVVKSTPSSMHSFYEVSRVFGPGKFCLTTVDTIFREEDFRRYIAAFEADDKAQGYMAVTDYIDDEKPLYVDVDSDMRITAFRDQAWPGARFISGGIYGLTAPASLDVLSECMDKGVSRMRNYQRALVEAGLDLRAYPMGKIIDVDHAGDIPKAEAFISSPLSI
ncbi:MAG: NTP transferase domain-containing protein [Bacteroides sp.]|nr:NTP transferase domain-containing protein [Bacteroides sp.]MDE6248840.1 NTP transferase domain-containing protein [Paramuribaculum sp.]MDE7449716.1 NTP transferase domain-containing protein [Paramuribaculum sp.]